MPHPHTPRSSVARQLDAQKGVGLGRVGLPLPKEILALGLQIENTMSSSTSENINSALE